MSACGGPDRDQLRLCRLVISGLEPPGATIEILGETADPETPDTVVIRYRSVSDAAEHWVACRFQGGGLDPDRLAIAEIRTDRSGRLSDAQLYLLRRFWVGSLASRQDSEPSDAASLETHILLALQQSMNAMTIGCVYGLLAIGYTLVFGLTERINLAFGELTMLGAYSTVIGILLLAPSKAALLPLALFLVLAATAALTALYSWCLERALFRPLRRAKPQSFLIATLGLAIALQEFVRLTQGTRERWLHRPFDEPQRLVEGSAFSVTATPSQLVILAATLALFGALRVVQRRTPFGRAQRACAEDVEMAALCGVAVDRVVGATFAMSGAFAGVAGLIFAYYYGGTHFFMGFLIGFKALVAAVVGGIGSVPGALIGGLIVGFVETFWSGYLAAAYKDIAVFALLAVFLVFRPNGLFGRARRLGE